MTGLSFKQLVARAEKEIEEWFPWDVEELWENDPDSKAHLLILDIREPYEYKKMRIENSLNVPRGILESACDWAYDETVPELVKARQRPILVVCRSGNRSLLAAQTMKQMGYEKVYSLKTGLRGWNEYELPLINDDGVVDIDEADEYHASKVRPEQLSPV